MKTEGYACQVCGKVLPTKRGLAGHLMFAHAEETFGVEAPGGGNPAPAVAPAVRRLVAPASGNPAPAVAPAVRRSVAPAGGNPAPASVCECGGRYRLLRGDGAESEARAAGYALICQECGDLAGRNATAQDEDDPGAVLPALRGGLLTLAVVGVVVPLAYGAWLAFAAWLRGLAARGRAAQAPAAPSASASGWKVAGEE